VIETAKGGSLAVTMGKAEPFAYGVDG